MAQRSLTDCARWQIKADLRYAGRPASLCRPMSPLGRGGQRPRPSGQAGGNAGKRSMVSAWLWSNISAMAAQTPRLPSIWNQPGGCESEKVIGHGLVEELPQMFPCPVPLEQSCPQRDHPRPAPTGLARHHSLTGARGSAALPPPRSAEIPLPPHRGRGKTGVTDDDAQARARRSPPTILVNGHPWPHEAHTAFPVRSPAVFAGLRPRRGSRRRRCSDGIGPWSTRHPA